MFFLSWPPFFLQPELQVLYFYTGLPWPHYVHNREKLKAAKQYLQIEGQFTLRQNSCMAQPCGLCERREKNLIVVVVVQKLYCPSDHEYMINVP